MQSKTTINRFTYFKALWEEGLWGKWLSIPWNAWGVFSFIRDELWRSAGEGRGRIINMIPHLPLAWWLIGALVIIIIWLFEASFKDARKKYEEIDGLKKERENDAFPNLNLGRLREFARRVINRNKNLPIINIILYRFYFNIPDSPTKYAIVAELDANRLSPEQTIEVHNFQYASAFRDNSFWGMDRSFDEVYKEVSQSNFDNEWLFVIKTSDETMPLGIMVNEGNIILYQSSISGI